MTEIVRVPFHGEDIRDGVDLPDDAAWDTPIGRLWADAYAVTWPRSGGGGTCSHVAPDACPRCDGSWLR